MSNPDEDTAIAQFGKDDKYFGVCILMATMPGLPMFAHGQIEGFTERYGMEFPRARWNENVDNYLVQRHQKEIFPLLKKRIIFSEVINFLLYDFQTLQGHVNENVFAYSNNNQNEKSLVIYNNKYENTSGYVNWANTVLHDDKDPVWIRKNLASALQIPNDPDHYLIFKDITKGLEYLRNCAELHQNGLYFDLDAFKYVVLLDFKIIKDTPDKKYARLAEYLQGGGVPDLNISSRKLHLGSLLDTFRSASDYEVLKKLMTITGKPADIERFLPEFNYRIGNFLQELNDYYPLKPSKAAKQEQIISSIKLWLKLPERPALDTFTNLMSYYIILLKEILPADQKEISKDLDLLCNKLFLAEEICRVLDQFEINLDPVRFTDILSVCYKNESDLTDLSLKSALKDIAGLLKLTEVRNLTGCNLYEGVTWFDKVKMEKFINLALSCSLFWNITELNDDVRYSKALKLTNDLKKKLQNAVVDSEYNLNRLIELLS